MNNKNDSEPNNRHQRRNSSSVIKLRSNIPIKQSLDNSDSNNTNQSQLNCNVDTNSHLLLANNNFPKTKKRSNSKVVRSKKLPQSNCPKLQSFSTTMSLPMENDLSETQTFYSEIENEKISIDSDIISGGKNGNTNPTSNFTNKESSATASFESDQLLNDKTYQKNWKKILSKMFFYDNRNAGSIKNTEDNFGIANQDDSPKAKELYVLMNKKETKKLMKMKSDSRYHKCDTLSVLSCTKGNIVKKFKNNVFQGVPDSLRGTLWQAIIDPFHSFCIKLNPEIASLMNIYNCKKSNANIDENSNQNNQSYTINRESVDEEIEEENETSSNDPNSHLSLTKSHTNTSLDSNSIIDDTNTSHSIEYVKVNVHTNPNLIQFLASCASQNIISSIEGDIGRTLVQFSKMSNPATQESLKKILAAYSVIDSDLGYSQGMAFIAAMLLLYMDENASFNSFCNIMLSKRFGFRNLFVNGFPRVIIMNKVWNVALQNYFPHLNRKLIQNNIDPIVYTMGWWLANFLNFPLPDDVLLLLFDRCLLFGSSSLISFGLTIFGVCREHLEKASIDEMIALLQMPSNCPKMLNSKEVIYQWNTNYWISKKNYAKILKKANVSYLP